MGLIQGGKYGDKCVLFGCTEINSALCCKDCFRNMGKDGVI